MVTSLFSPISIFSIKLFNIYAIVSAVSFVTFGISLFTSYAQYSNLFVFLPLHFAFSLFVAALSMLECKITTQFAKSVVSILAMLVIALGEIVLLNSISWLVVIIGLALLLVPILGLIAVIIDKRSDLNKNKTANVRGK